MTIGVFGPLEMVAAIEQWHRRAGVIEAKFVGADDPDRITREGPGFTALCLATGSLRMNPGEWHEICQVMADVSQRAALPVFVLSTPSGRLPQPLPALEAWHPVILHGEGHEVVWGVRHAVGRAAQDLLVGTIRHSVPRRDGWTPRLFRTVLGWIEQDIQLPTAARGMVGRGEKPYIRWVTEVGGLQCRDRRTLGQFRHDAARANLDRSAFVREVELFHFARCFLPEVPEWAAWSLGYREWETLKRSIYRRWGVGPSELAARSFGEQAERVLGVLGIGA